MANKVASEKFGLLITLFFISTLNVQARLVFREYRARVKVYVKGEGDDGFKEKTKSCLIGEFKKIKDVAILEENAEWELIILIQKSETESGDAPGLLLSTNVNHFEDAYNRPYYRNIKGWESTHVKDGHVSTDYEFEINSPVVYIFKRNPLNPDFQKELKEVCRQIVEDFNNIYLAEDRKSYEEIMKSFEGLEGR